MKVQRKIILAALLTVIAGAANAELRVCNKTSHVQGLSIGYKSGSNWVSEGWWNLDPGSCATPVRGDLKQRYYYYRAEINGGGFDGEDYMFCTSTSEYTIVGDENCGARGYDRESFREIDTGATATSHTVNLVP